MGASALTVGVLQHQVEPLTPREREVLLLVEIGLSYVEVGQRLGIVEKTVRSHVSNIMGKLHVRNARAAIAKMRWLGMSPQWNLSYEAQIILIAESMRPGTVAELVQAQLVRIDDNTR